MSDCLFFGCWNQPGHYLVGPGGRRAGIRHELSYALSRELDGQFAPKRASDGSIIIGDFHDSKDWPRYIRHRNAVECPQGQFLRHELRGYTLIQWWDRCQGDDRGACNSTVLLEGVHSSAEMLAALAEHFPHVLANLKRAGVELVEIAPLSDPTKEQP